MTKHLRVVCALLLAMFASLTGAPQIAHAQDQSGGGGVLSTRFRKVIRVM